MPTFNLLICQLWLAVQLLQLVDLDQQLAVTFPQSVDDLVIIQRLMVIRAHFTEAVTPDTDLIIERASMLSRSIAIFTGDQV